MSPEVLALAAAVIAIVLLVAGGVYWWMNRSPNLDRDADEILPLFGLERDADGQQWVGDRLASGALSAMPRPATPSRPVVAVQAPPGGAGSAAAMAAAKLSAQAEPSRPDYRTPTGGTGRQGALGNRPPSATPGQRMTPLEVLRAIPDTPQRRAVGEAATAYANPAVRSFTTGAPSSTGGSTGVRPPVVGEAVLGHGVPGTMVEGERLRFSVPAEGTLQFLPGRLQIGAGLDSGREIRFVNVPGPDGATITFGRSEGALYRHIQLRDQTVSRSHARMQLVNGRWELRNLSRTNPVVHNDRALESGETQVLQDGDRIEMGEVLFTFRER